MAKDNKQELPRSQEVLFDYFQFDEADLDANRLGAFSDRQKKELKADKKDSKKSFILVGVICLGVGLVVLFLMIGHPLLQGSRFDWVDVVNMFSTLLITLAFMGVGIYSLYKGMSSADKELEHSIGSVTGGATIVEAGRATYHSPYRRRILYELRIGAKEFNTYDGLPKAVTQGDVYTVYFDNADDEIMSVEWVSK